MGSKEIKPRRGPHPPGQRLQTFTPASAVQAAALSPAVPLATPLLQALQLLARGRFFPVSLPTPSAAALPSRPQPSGVAGSSVTVWGGLISSVLHRMVTTTPLLQQRQKRCREPAFVPVPRTASPARPATTARDMYEVPYKLCC